MQMTNYNFIEILDSETGKIKYYKFNDEKIDYVFTESRFEGLDISVEFVFEGVSRISIDAFQNFDCSGLKLKFLKCSFLGQIPHKGNNCEINLNECTFKLNTFSITGIKNSIYKLSNSLSQISIKWEGLENCEILINKFSIYEMAFINSSLSKLKVVSNKIEIKSLSFYHSSVVDYMLSDINYLNLTIAHSSFGKSVFNRVTSNRLFYQVVLSEEKADIDNYVLLFDSFELNNCQFGMIQPELGKTPDFKVCFNELKIINLSNFNVFNVKIGRLSYQGNQIENVKFFNCEINNISFNDFNVEKNFRFELVKVIKGGNSLDINSSSLNKIVINPSFFHCFENITFKNSSLMGVEVIHFELIEPRDINRFRISHKEKIDFTRELNFLMKNQNNSYDATKYKALEQNLRFKSEKWLSMDWVILLMNRFSNNHGTKPQYALISLFLLMLVYLFFLDIEFKSENSYLNAFSFFKDNFSYFFKPLSFVSDIEDVNHQFSLKFRMFDILYKILYAYIVYQFVAAFRKFNK